MDWSNIIWCIKLVLLQDHHCTCALHTFCDHSWGLLSPQKLALSYSAQLDGDAQYDPSKFHISKPQGWKAIVGNSTGAENPPHQRQRWNTCGTLQAVLAAFKKNLPNTLAHPGLPLAVTSSASSSTPAKAENNVACIQGIWGGCRTKSSKLVYNGDTKWKPCSQRSNHSNSSKEQLCKRSRPVWDRNWKWILLHLSPKLESQSVKILFSTSLCTPLIPPPIDISAPCPCLCPSFLCPCLCLHITGSRVPHLCGPVVHPSRLKQIAK